MENMESNNTKNASDHQIVEEDLENGKNVATEDERISDSAEIRNLEQKILETVGEIKETVRQVSTVPTTQCFIYRTPRNVRILNKAAYTPRVVSIGPYHHFFERFKSMEGRKREYCRDLIERTNNMPLPEIISKMTTYEGRLRDAYEGIDKIESHTLLAMVLVDGCFILEYMLKSCYDKDTSQDVDINHDILLQENQIPFEILKFLFRSIAPIPTIEIEVSRGNVVPREIFKKIKAHQKTTVQTEEQNETYVFIKELLKANRKCKKHNPVSTTNMDDVWDKILVLLVVEFFKGINTYKEDGKVPKASEVMHITDLIRKLHEPKNQTPDPKYIDSKFTTTATRLHEAGVKFKTVSGKCLLDIEFKNQCLEIPIFEINENRLSLYRNLMVLEFCHYPSKSFITDYFVFMDTLIDSSDDVNLLVKNGVLFNKLGHYSDTAKFFNNFCGGIHPKSGNSYLMRICADLNAYYKEPSNVWCTTFKRDYCGTPIRIASTIGAGMLIVLTFISTAYAILAYHKPPA